MQLQESGEMYLETILILSEKLKNVLSQLHHRDEKEGKGEGDAESE